MANKERYVFDTNVIVSALLFNDSIPGRAFFGAIEQGVLLPSRSLVEQLQDVLSRDKFDKYITLAERERLLGSLIRDAELVEITTTVQACRDPDDDAILELAIDGGAEVVVTGDKDLLVLDPFQGVRILTPAQVLDRIGK